VQPRRDFKELQLPVDQFIMEGARQLDERRRIAAVIPDSNCIPRVAQAIDETRLTPAGAAVLAQIDGARSIEEVALACRMPQFPVLSFIFQGVQNKVFELLPAADPPPRIPGFYRSTWRDRILEAESNMALGDMLEAYRKVLEVREQYASVPKALAAAADLERDIVAEVEKLQFGPSTILELALAPKDIVQLKCAPEEGFVLSRVNGRYSMVQILALLPGGKLYNQLIIHNLIQRGVLKTRESQELVRHPGAPRLRT
jgi:hypothetical protein